MDAKDRAAAVLDEAHSPTHAPLFDRLVLAIQAAEAETSAERNAVWYAAVDHEEGEGTARNCAAEAGAIVPDANAIDTCRVCMRVEGEVCHPRGRIFIGWGRGWETCSACEGTTRAHKETPLKAATVPQPVVAVEQTITLMVAAHELAASRWGTSPERDAAQDGERSTLKARYCMRAVLNALEEAQKRSPR